MILLLLTLSILFCGCGNDVSITGPGGIGGGHFGSSALTICGDAFCINGNREFLLGISYYGALTASDGNIQRDLDDMVRYGFNWVRVWATWAYTQDVSVITPYGGIREPYMGRLKRFIGDCNSHGIIVDVSLAHGEYPYPTSFSDHLMCVTTLAQELAPYRNVYFDVSNEFDVDGLLDLSKIGDLITAIKQVDPGRLCTASGSGEDINAYFQVGHVDFLAPHLSRDSGAEHLTFSSVVGLKSSAIAPVGVHLQEPFRRGYDLRHAAGEVPPFVAQNFLDDLSSAVLSGAAGWCFHNGATYKGAPYKSFDMSTQRLFEQLDEEEMEVVRNVKRYK